MPIQRRQFTREFKLDYRPARAASIISRSQVISPLSPASLFATSRRPGGRIR